MSRQLINRGVMGGAGSDPALWFQANVGETFVVPDMITTTSPTGDAKLNSKRQGAGGQLFAAYSDVAGGASPEPPFSCQDLGPGTTVALSAVAGGKTTVTLTSKDGLTVRTFTITCTTFAGVIGFYN